MKSKNNYQSVTNILLFLPRYPIKLIQMRTHGSVGRKIQAKSLTHGISQTLLIGHGLYPIIRAICTCISTYVNSIGLDRRGPRADRPDTETRDWDWDWDWDRQTDRQTERERARESERERHDDVSSNAYMTNSKGTFGEWIRNLCELMQLNPPFWLLIRSHQPTTVHQLTLLSCTDYPKKTDKAAYCATVQVYTNRKRPDSSAQNVSNRRSMSISSDHGWRSERNCTVHSPHTPSHPMKKVNTQESQTQSTRDTHILISKFQIPPILRVFW